MMVLLVLRGDALQYGIGLCLRRLVHCYRLETTLKSSILLYMLSVFVKSCGTDDLQLSSCKCRLQDVCCVQCSFRSSCTDDGVYLIDEKKDVSVISGFCDDSLYALFELPAVLGTGNHAGDVQGNETFVLDGLRYIT